MSSSNPRVVRGPTPRKTYTNATYRKAIESLLRDFESRCAYSMQHLQRAGGLKCMEVDHFRPKGKIRNHYNNFLPATRHCNGAKGQQWPTAARARQGVRLLNPTKEKDYGEHIFQDPKTHELVGVTTPGKYQIVVCDLNAAHFFERRERARLHDLLNRGGNVKSNFANVADTVATLRRQLAQMIPPIPAPSM